jgi:hypothetical protein
MTQMPCTDVALEDACADVAFEVVLQHGVLGKPKMREATFLKEPMSLKSFFLRVLWADFWEKIRCRLYPPCLTAYMPWMAVTCSVNTIQPHMVEAEE